MIKLRHVALTGTFLLPALSAQPDLKAPSFKFAFETLGGQKFDQDHFKNSVLILDFWGTWCPPCREAVPALVELYGKYKHHGLEVVGLNYREKGTPAEAAKTVREFAQEHGITYTLAMGTPEIQKQVIGFSGYPTMLFFKKGMQFDHLEVGFAADHKEAMEKWVREQLGLDGAQPKDGKTAGTKGDDDDKATAAKVKVPDGVIFRPGNHDTGFDFEVKGVDGKDVKFSDYRGKKVVVACTSTWDQEAANTAKLLNEIHAKYAGKEVVVIAASLEIKKERDEKLAAIEPFVKQQGVKYTVLPVGVDFLKKIWEPGGIPLFLVFDDKGTLILRQKSDTHDTVLKAIEQALGLKP